MRKAKNENFNLTQKVKYRTVSVPGYSLLFNTNEKGPEFIEKLFSKGILSKDGKKYRVLFSPPLNMTKKEGVYNPVAFKKKIYSAKELISVSTPSPDNLIVIGQLNLLDKLADVCIDYEVDVKCTIEVRA